MFVRFNAVDKVALLLCLATFVITIVLLVAGPFTALASITGAFFLQAFKNYPEKKYGIGRLRGGWLIATLFAITFLLIIVTPLFQYLSLNLS